MQLPNTPHYTVEQVRQAQAGHLVSILFGYVVIEAGCAKVYARSVPGVEDANPKFGIGLHTYRAIQNWQRFVYWLLASTPDRLRTPAEIRARQATPQEPCWLDRQPYQVLVNDTDRLVGYLERYTGPNYVLVVRGETLMAAIWETASTVGLVNVGRPVRHETPP